MFNYSSIVLFLLFTDILTKWLVTVFGFPYSRNYKLFLGSLEDRGNLSLILGLISILAVVIFLRKNNTLKVGFNGSPVDFHASPVDPTWISTVRVWSSAVFLSGALGNFFTKLFLGYIIDFLPGGFMGRFFNLADVYLFTGLIGIFISEIRRDA